MKFTAESIRAIFEGRKTQTRRPIKSILDPYQPGARIEVETATRAHTGIVILIASAKIERLHEIDDRQSRLEGVADREAFRELWGTLYAADDPSAWDRNPLVVVYGFSVEARYE